MLRLKPGDVVSQVGGRVWRVGQQPFKVIPGCVVEGEPRRTAKLPVKVVQPSSKLGLPFKHDLFCGRQHAVQPPQHCQRQDYVLVLTPLDGVAYEVGYIPNETDDLAVVHGFSTWILGFQVMPLFMNALG